MKQSLYSAEVSPKCEYCSNGILSPTGKEVLCRKKGIMQTDSFCKKFKYDPLKRKPEQVKLKSDYSAEDFMLAIDDFSL